jgi:hypothetical protein
MLRFEPIPILKDIMGTLVLRKNITLALRRHYGCRILINMVREYIRI